MTASTRHGMTSIASYVVAASVAALLAALLAGCAGQPAAPTETAPAPAPAPVTPPPPPPPAPPTAAQQQQAQKVAQGVVDLLEVGNEEQARSELKNALTLDPNNKLALSLKRQMTEDPVVALGSVSFPYVVRSGDTLSRIAGTYMGDIYAFHILARYNNIKVPRQVAAGQTIRIPGKAPSPTVQSTREPRRAEPAPAAPAAAVVPAQPAEPNAGEVAYRSGEAAAKAGMYEKALADYRRAASLGNPKAGAQADATAKRLIDIHSRNAHAAMARQDLDGAIRSWDEVLEIDPNNETARLEKQKALRLKAKVKALPN